MIDVLKLIQGVSIRKARAVYKKAKKKARDGRTGQLTARRR